MCHFADECFHNYITIALVYWQSCYNVITNALLLLTMLSQLYYNCPGLLTMLSQCYYNCPVAIDNVITMLLQLPYCYWQFYYNLITIALPLLTILIQL